MWDLDPRWLQSGFQYFLFALRKINPIALESSSVGLKRRLKGETYVLRFEEKLPGIRAVDMGLPYRTQERSKTDSDLHASPFQHPLT